MLLFMMPRTCLAITLFIFVLVFLMIDINCNSHPVPNCNWSKAKVEHIEKYQLALNNKLSSITMANGVNREGLFHRIF